MKIKYTNTRGNVTEKTGRIGCELGTEIILIANGREYSVCTSAEVLEA